MCYNAKYAERNGCLEFISRCLSMGQSFLPEACILLIKKNIP